jgi:hypothetical protein
VGLKSLKSLNLTNGYPNKNNKNNKNKNNKVKSKPLELRSRVKNIKSVQKCTSCPRHFNESVKCNIVIDLTDRFIIFE